VKLDGGLADAWNELRRTLGHRIPAAVNDTTRLRRRIKASGRR
jgi:hypothetical protein